MVRSFRLSPPARAAWASFLPVVTGLAFLASAMTALWLNRGTDGIPALWPANAILLATLILSRPATRWRHVAACAIASMAANRWGGSPLAPAALFTAANMTSALLAHRLLRRPDGVTAALETPRDIVAFLTAVAIAAGAGGTVAAAAWWVATGVFLPAFLSCAASDLLGMMLITPVLLGTARRLRTPRRRRAGRPSASPVGPLAAVAIATMIVFNQCSYPLLFVPLAVLLIATYRLGLPGAFAGTAIVAGVGSVYMANGLGPIAMIQGAMAVRILFFQFYLATIYATCLPLATLLAERARLAREREESDRRHRRILDRSREVIFETDLPGRWTYLNPAWEMLTGHPIDGSIGRSFLSLLHLDDRASAIERLTPLHAGEIEACRQDVRFVHADGRILWASVRSHLLTDEAGVVIGTHGTIHDVTDRMTAQAAQRESDRLYRILADNSNDMIVNFSVNGVRRYVSPASITVLGFTPDELTGQPAAGAIHPDDRATVLATCRTLLDGAENPICSYRQLHKNGRYVWLEASYRLIRDATGAPDGFIASVRDVGRRAAAELARTEESAKLEAANRLLLMAEEMSGVGHWRVDLASAEGYWSDVVCAIHGVPAGHRTSMDAGIDWYHPDDRAFVRETVTAALTAGRDYELNARIIRPDGAVRHVKSKGRAETGPSGLVTGLFGVFQDVTELHEAAQALRVTSECMAESNRMLTMAETVARLGHWRVDDTTGHYFWSDEVYRIFGLAPDFVPTFRTMLPLYHPDDRSLVEAAVRDAIRSGSSYSYRARIVRPDGSIAHVFVRGEVDQSVGGAAHGRFGILQDVSEQTQAEELRRREEARYRLITEQASDMIAIHDIDGRCIFMSPAARSVLGYDPDDMLGTCAQDYAPPADHAALAVHSARVRSSEPGTVSILRFRMRDAAGDMRWMEVAARLADYDGRSCVIAVARDVSEQVRAEDAVHEARSQAEAAARAKSSFLANMSHEIRTPMNGVVGFTELLLAGDLNPEQRRHTELIADSSRAMMRLLNDILDLSKVEAGQMTVADEPFDLIHALKACMTLIAPAAEQKGLELHCAFDADLPRIVLGDGLRLRQIVLNLLGNAAKFTLQGSITLRASIRNGSRLAIEVEDTGIGIAADRHAAVFEHFVQAHEGIAARFGGTGLGLAISSQLARLMGGDLTFDSAPGRGTRFVLSLPLAAMLTDRPLPDADAAQRMAPSPSDAGIRILVVEDHDVNQMLICAMLEKLGTRPDLANNGREAVAMVADAVVAGRPYSLVFMDMQMPEMDGLEATRRIRAAGMGEAALPIVALTANAYADDVAACLAAGMQAHLSKPLSMEKLEAAVRAWLPSAPVTDPRGAARFSAAIQARYRLRKTETLRCLDEMVRTGAFEEAELRDVSTMLHKLAGTAQMFGDVTLGIEARLLETGLDDWTDADREERIVRGVEAIRRAA